MMGTNRPVEPVVCEVLRRIQAVGEVRSGALSPDGALLVTEAALEVTEAKFDGRICAWEIATGDLRWTADLTSWSSALLFTPDGKEVALATGLAGRRDGRDGRLLFLDATTGATARELPTTPGAFGLAISPDGRYAAAGHSEEYSDDRSHGHKGVIRIYDLSSGKPVQALEPHLNQIHAVAFAPDGKTVASSGLLRNADPEAVDIWLGADVRLWDLESGTKRHQLPRPAARGMRHNLVFSPDGRFLAAPNGREGEVLLWETDSGALVRTLPGAGSSVFALTFAPDGKRLAAGCLDGQVRLFDLETGVAKELEGHDSSVTLVLFTPDNTRLVTADRQGSVRIRQV